MAVNTQQSTVSTRGDADIIDITSRVAEKLRASGMQNGIVNISVAGSTAALTTCEYEPGLVGDIKELLDKLIPRGNYHHDDTWGDGNGHAHLRASLIGPSVTLPFSDGRLLLGTWQQIILIDCDNRPRSRKITCQFVGE